MNEKDEGEKGERQEGGQEGSYIQVEKRTPVGISW